MRWNKKVWKIGARVQRNDNKFFELFNRRNLSERKVNICRKVIINVNVFSI